MHIFKRFLSPLPILPDLSPLAYYARCYFDETSCEAGVLHYREKKEFIVEKTLVCKCQVSAKMYQQHFKITKDISKNSVINTERIFDKTYSV
jgi:hypothetical protein